MGRTWRRANAFKIILIEKQIMRAGLSGDMRAFLFGSGQWRECHPEWKHARYANCRRSLLPNSWRAGRFPARRKVGAIHTRRPDLCVQHSLNLFTQISANPFIFRVQTNQIAQLTHFFQTGINQIIVQALEIHAAGAGKGLVTNYTGLDSYHPDRPGCCQPDRPSWP